MAVKAQLDALDTRLEVATEDRDQAEVRYQSVTRQVNVTQTRLGKIQRRIGTLQDHLDTRAEDMYRNGPAQFLEMLLGAVDFDQFTSTWDILTDMSRSDADAVIQLKVARREANALRSQLRKQQAQASTQLNIMRERRSRIVGDLAQRKRMLSGIESEIAALEQAEAAREAAAVRAAAQRRTFIPASFSPVEHYSRPTKSAHGGVVSIAMRYLGYPYSWGAAGPNSFDCSGFTMYVYAQVGISLPHSSRDQFNSGQHVSRSDLQPGDLVFFGSPIHHVGIYVGGGSFIHAPHTGDHVKISPLDRLDYVGAVRP